MRIGKAMINGLLLFVIGDDARMSEAQSLESFGLASSSRRFDLGFGDTQATRQINSIEAF